MEEKKKKDVLELLLSGERLTKKIKTKRGIFVIAFPLPRDIRIIEIEVARMLDGESESAFSKVQIANFRAYATLDRMVVEAPEWWNELSSPEDCPDDDLITLLYGRYLQFYQKVQESIGKSRYTGDNRIGKTRTKDENVDN